MKKLLLIIVFLLGGCGVINAIKYRDLKVAVAFDGGAPKDCEIIKSVYYVEHVFKFDDIKENSIKHFTKVARTLGANYVYVTKHTQGWWDSRKSGGPFYGLDADVYKCEKP